MIFRCVSLLQQEPEATPTITDTPGQGAGEGEHNNTKTPDGHSQHSGNKFPITCLMQERWLLSGDAVT